MYGIGELTIKMLGMLTGLLLIARYYHCDPLQLNMVKKLDGILPYFVIDIARNIPGLPGLFMAGILSASLRYIRVIDKLELELTKRKLLLFSVFSFSTLSACLNSLSGNIYEDFISRYVSKNIKQKTVSNILKLLVVIIGLIIVALVFIVERLGGILSLGISIAGATGGPSFGLFSLGILIPKANAKVFFKNIPFVSRNNFNFFIGCILGYDYIDMPNVLDAFRNTLL